MNRKKRAKRRSRKVCLFIVEGHTVAPRAQKCSFYENKLESKHIPKYDKNDFQLLERFMDKAKVVAAIENYPKIGAIPEKYFLRS